MSVTRLLPQVLAQLSNRLERVLDQSSATDNDVRLAFHSNAQGQALPFSSGNCRFFEGSESNEARAIARADCGGANPIQFSVERPVALVRKRFEKVTDLLSNGELRQTSFLQHQSRTQRRVPLCELTKHLTLLNDAAHCWPIQRNDHAIIGTANREQVLLRVFKVCLQSGGAHLEFLNFRRLFAA